tara:strand:+ start:53 stop:406 length:354 start_codon:yes stop_codon:yes gene_type:complete
MSDILNIRVTEEELDLIMLLLEQAGTMEDSNGQPAFELLHDLMEQSGNSDEWEPTEIAEDAFVNAGIRAREMQKATSRAAERRNARFGEFEVEDAETVEQRLMRGTAQPIANDPIDW